MKRTALALTLSWALLFLAIAGTVHFGTVQATTEVYGIISTDTTWTKTNSPYNLTEPTTVENGATLTIESGVTVNLGSYYIEVNGTLVARGTSTNQIQFNGGQITFTSAANGWNEQTGSGCIIENAILSSTSISSSIALKINNNAITGSISVGGSSVISNNTITGWNTTIGSGLEVGKGNVSIFDNVISGYLMGIFWDHGGTATIERNLIFNNSYGISIGTDVKLIIRNNTIANNLYGIAGLISSSNIILYNNFQNNSYNIYLGMYVGNDVNATYNWWGTTDQQAISQTIWDKKNDFNLGTVTFVPFLNAPYSGATTHISISVDASSTAVGSAVNVNGRLVDSNGNPLQSKSVTLSYAVAGSTSWVPIGSATTNTAGEYSIQWINTASGTFTLKTEWNGNADYPEASITTTLSFLPYENQNIFLVESNSTVSVLAFNSTSSELSFNVSGPSETTGYVKVTIAKSLVSNAENIKVYLDGNQLNYAVTSNTNAWLLTFTYQHSIHQVRIDLAINGNGTPLLEIEYWAWIVVAIIIVVISVSLLVYFKKRKNQSE